MKRLIINKNRGWRGLAELKVYNENGTLHSSMVFSFSSDVWNDMLGGRIVIQDPLTYFVIYFDNTDALPHGHQRSVLIKDFNAEIKKVNRYEKSNWRTYALTTDYVAINHFINNRNNHTNSNWNCIGMRVTPNDI